MVSREGLSLWCYRPGLRMSCRIFQVLPEGAFRLTMGFPKGKVYPDFSEVFLQCYIQKLPWGNLKFAKFSLLSIIYPFAKFQDLKTWLRNKITIPMVCLEILLYLDSRRLVMANFRLKYQILVSNSVMTLTRMIKIHNARACNFYIGGLAKYGPHIVAAALKKF